MVRRIAWMVNEGSSSRMDPDSVGPEAKNRPGRVGLAPPEYLVLMDIDCGIDFSTDTRASRGIFVRLEKRIRQDGMRLVFAENLQDALR